MSTTELLIADYLKRHGLTSTLKQFENEAGFTHQDVNYETLETIVQDKIKFIEHHEITPQKKVNDLVENANLFSKLSLDDDVHSINPKELTDFKALVIHISQGELIIQSEKYNVLIITSNDKSTIIWDISNSKILFKFFGLHPSVGKCAYPINNSNKFISCGMDGKAKLFKLESLVDEPILINEVQLHRRLITDIKIWKNPNNQDELYIFSIGWDGFLNASIINNDEIILKSQFKLLSNPTTLAIGTKDQNPIIFITRLDSTQLFTFTYKNDRLWEILRISLNDAEFSSHGFTPMSISLSNDIITNDTLIAIGTSHIPYMRIIITKIPELELGNIDLNQSLEQQLSSVPITRGQILGNYNSLAPQDKFSQSLINWKLNSKSNIWIGSDDGCLKLLNLHNGEILLNLSKGHNGNRIKSFINVLENDKEVLFTSGIDKKLNYWSSS
ncbi:hypothetical protein BN7_1844 [Wickerhamomyces ciferrii]|uniref:LisH domain-containing protein n=1 Tax=Wickerhamomyces ciferrii (strain ATCC 14091 / BCRC 22168 / CBS 111 / JCM 3599 / NBRC 0793 / NRRL Y-1031 F-60-10) TaxID=1206466 RepID=K0KBC2_WICCF|nr:uncharacterized protein BN7_1844 [Wickerhamomyces ciferrii]CCH42300.1 hypothetical protein BN7_1844 [Wickerhamomyces ciferrii]